MLLSKECDYIFWCTIEIDCITNVLDKFTVVLMSGQDKDKVLWALFVTGLIGKIKTHLLSKSLSFRLFRSKNVLCRICTCLQHKCFIKLIKNNVSLDKLPKLTMCHLF